MQRIVYTRQQELPLGINYAPDIVRRHGLQEAHIQPFVARHKGESFRVHARHAWGYPSIELRAGNSWPAIVLDCDLPAVVESLHGLRSKFPLPVPNMAVERRSNSHCHASWFLSRPVHRGESARAAPLRKLARITEFYRDVLQALMLDTTACLTHNPLPEETHGRSGVPNSLAVHEYAPTRLTNWPKSIPQRLALADHTDAPTRAGTVRFSLSLDQVGRITVQSQGRGPSHGTGHQ